jgi:hypothetical protein
MLTTFKTQETETMLVAPSIAWREQQRARNVDSWASMPVGAQCTTYYRGQPLAYYILDVYTKVDDETWRSVTDSRRWPVSFDGCILVPYGTRTITECDVRWT